MTTRTIDRLMTLEIYAYRRWLVAFSPFWRGLAAACNRAVKQHGEYRGVR